MSTNSLDQALRQMDSIRSMVANLEAAPDDSSRENARDAIIEDPLSVEVRDGWRSLGEMSTGPCEYRILLCTGGPAAQIVGSLNDYVEPETATLMHQDWFEPWQEVELEESDTEALLTYARQFYFGD